MAAYIRGVSPDIFGALMALVPRARVRTVGVSPSRSALKSFALAPAPLVGAAKDGQMSRARAPPRMLNFVVLIVFFLTRTRGEGWGFVSIGAEVFCGGGGGREGDPLAGARGSVRGVVAGCGMWWRGAGGGGRGGRRGGMWWAVGVTGGGLGSCTREGLFECKG